MRFSEDFQIKTRDDDDWFDVIPSQDTPLYVDPFLLLDDLDPRWRDARAELTSFFAAAAELVILADGAETSPAWAKAVRLLTFPEPKEFALGFSIASPDGSGTGPKVAKQMAEVLALVGTSGAENLASIAGFSLFCEGVGPDGMSDILCNVLKSHFIKYTQDVAKKHGLRMEKKTILHSGWDSERGKWKNESVDLPVCDGRAVILVPSRFLKDLPEVTPDHFWSWASYSEMQVLREELNFDLAQSMSKSERIKAARTVARERPEIAFNYVKEVAGKGQSPYDVAADESGLVKWLEGGRELAQLAAPVWAQVKHPNQEGFEDWVLSLADSFKHVVEETDGWRILWDDALEKKRDEKVAQALAGIMWRSECKAANVDLSKEVNMGRGPVDFKFTQGWEKKALLEVKYIGSSKFFSGAEKQLPQYLRTEMISFGVYLAIGFQDSDFVQERIDRVKRTCAHLTKESGVTMKCIFVDARPDKPSASKL